MKSSVYRNAVVTACALGLLIFLAGCWQMKVSFEAANPDTAANIPNNIPQKQTNQSLSNDNSTENLHTINTSDTALLEKTEPTNSILVARQQSADPKKPGNLRMSNQTDQPVRLALLARQSGKKSAKTKQADVPAHWDFDPQEGSSKGLILSLPNGSLKLEKGDILVAFAQDGSRRYWGPYVVGETSQPAWNSQNQEWVLVLNP